MAPTVVARHRNAHKNKKGRSSAGGPRKTMTTPVQMLHKATELLQENEAQKALKPAQAALSSLQSSHGEQSPLTLPALSLISEIQLELGDAASAIQTFKTAAAIDSEGSIPEDQGGGADKFLYLAQLDEEGGRASLGWFEKAVSSLERRIAALESGGVDAGNLDAQLELAEQKTKLSHALCGMCELWMTDLSFEDAAEAECEALVTRAVMLTPDDAEALQTLASIRLSQEKPEEAQAALVRSLELWSDLPPGHPMVPEFAARISLARTLMAAGMLGDALEVCERLVGEEDQSVEAWYLGGWCQHLIAQADEENETGKDEEMVEGAEDEEEEEEEEEKLGPEEKKAILLSSREWLRNCLKLCQLLEYEDDRLRDHAKELVEGLDKSLGDAEIDEEEEWEGIESDEDGDEKDDVKMDES